MIESLEQNKKRIAHINKDANYTKQRDRIINEHLIQFEGCDSFGVQFIMEDGSIMSHANTEDWDNATSLQRLIGFFWKGYKNRFIKPEPFKAKLSSKEKDHGRSVILTGGIQLDCKVTEEDNNYVL